MAAAFKDIGWHSALQALQKLVPKADGLGLDGIYAAVQEGSCALEELQLPGWEDMDDSEIFDWLVVDLKPSGETSILIPFFCCCGHHLPFEVQESDVRAFVLGFFANFGESFFNGDTILLYPAQKAFFYFDHNGFAGRVRAKSSKSPF